MNNSAEWNFSQAIGDKPMEEIVEADVISAIEFNETGEFCAVGDKGGRINIYKQNTTGVIKSASMSNEPTVKYEAYTNFQSHDPAFDYLKSIDIEEKINKIRWCKRKNSAMHLLTCNDKTIKLWKVFDREVKTVSSMNIASGTKLRSGTPPKIDSLIIPKISVNESVICASERRKYADAHAYHINSIAINSDGEHYISADDLRINLWNIERSDQSFNIIDIKPENMEDLTEVITCAEFHPTSCNIFMYANSGGNIKLSDMRSSALCDEHVKVFAVEEDPSTKSFFTEIIASVSDCKFTNDGRYIVSRDYLTLKIWDINMESKPVRTIQIRENLRAKLCDLYENDCIFDKFETSISNDGQYYLTGSYNNCFHIYDRYGKVNKVTEAAISELSPGKRKYMNHMSKQNSMSVISPGSMDFAKKAMHLAWHPSQNAVAVASLNVLYLYQAMTP